MIGVDVSERMLEPARKDWAYMTTARRLSIEEAGQALGVSPSTVWRMIRRGDLPTVRERGRRLVLAEALTRRARPKARPTVSPLTRDHPIFRLVGAGHGGGRVPGAMNKHAIVDR